MNKKRFRTKICTLLVGAMMLASTVLGLTARLDNRSAAAASADLTNGLRFVQVVSGLHHTLALTESGDIYGWGSNMDNRLGLGGLDMAGSYFNEPVLVFSSSELGEANNSKSMGAYGTAGDTSYRNDKVIKIAATEHTSAFITATGEVFFAGANAFWEFGSSASVSPESYPSSEASQLAAFYNSPSGNRTARWIRYNHNIGINATWDDNGNPVDVVMYAKDIVGGARNYAIVIKSGTYTVKGTPSTSPSYSQNDILITGPNLFGLNGANATMNADWGETEIHLLYTDIAYSAASEQGEIGTAQISPSNNDSRAAASPLSPLRGLSASSLVMGGTALYVRTDNALQKYGKGYYLNSNAPSSVTLHNDALDSFSGGVELDAYSTLALNVTGRPGQNDPSRFDYIKTGMVTSTTAYASEPSLSVESTSQIQLKDAYGVNLSEAAATVLNPRRYAASETFGYIATSNSITGWGNDSKGQTSALTNVNNLLNGKTITQVVAGQTEHVPYAQRLSGALDGIETYFFKTELRDPDVIAQEESNQEYISAVLTSDSKVIVWGNIEDGELTGGSHVDISDRIAGKPQIVSLYSSYKRLYILSVNGKIYEYKGIDGTINEINTFKQHDGTAFVEINDITTRQQEKITMNLNEVVSLSLSSGVVGSTGSQPLVTSSLGNAYRFAVPEGKNKPVASGNVPNGVGVTLADSALAATHQIQDDYATRDSAITGNVNQVAYSFVHGSGQTSAITSPISNINEYISLNFTYADSTSSMGNDIIMNIKALKRTPEVDPSDPTTEYKAIRISYNVIVYAAHTMDFIDSSQIYEVIPMYVDIHINNTMATVNPEVSSDKTLNNFVPVIDFNTPDNDAYSYASMNASAGFIALATYLDGKQPDFDATAIQSEIQTQVVSKDDGYNGTAYKYLFYDSDGDRVFSDTIFIDSLSASDFSIEARMIALKFDFTNDLDANLMLGFQNYYGFDFEISGKTLTVSYEIIYIKAIKTTVASAGAYAEARSFTLVHNQMPLSAPGLVIGPDSTVDASSLKKLEIKVESTINIATSGTIVKGSDQSGNDHYTISLPTLAIYTQRTLNLSSYLTDNLLSNFAVTSTGSTGEQQVAFESSFNKSLISVSFSAKTISLTANFNSGEVKFDVFVLRTGVIGASTTPSIVQAVRLTFVFMLSGDRVGNNVFAVRGNVSPESLDVFQERTVPITDYFIGHGTSSITAGSLITIQAVSIANPAMMSVSINQKEPNQIQTLTFTPIGAGKTDVIISVTQYNVTLIGTFTFTVSGIATYDEMLYINADMRLSLVTFKQFAVVRNGLSSIDNLEYLEDETKIVRPVVNGNVTTETELTTAESDHILKILRDDNLLQYSPSTTLTAADDPRVNVIYSFKSTTSNLIYRVRHQVHITRVTIMSQSSNPESEFYFDNAKSNVHTIDVATLAKYGVPNFNPDWISRYDIRMVYLERIIDGNVLVAEHSFVAGNEAIEFTLSQSGEQVMCAVVREMRGDVQEFITYNVYFTITVVGITTVLPKDTYRTILLVAVSIMLVLLLVVFMIRMGIYWKKKANERRIVKRNRDIIKMRETLHGRSGVATRKNIVKTKLKMEDPRYSKVFNQVKLEKMEESGTISTDALSDFQDNKGKKVKDKSKGGKKGVKEMKAELDAKKAKFAQMQGGDIPLDLDDETAFMQTPMDGYEITDNGFDNGDIPSFDFSFETDDNN